MIEKSSFIRATRIGGHAWQYLTTRSCKGQVVSSFSGGINLLFEDGEAFIPIQATSVPLHPWAIEIPGRALFFAEGTPVTAGELQLIVGDTRIMFSTAQVEELSLPRFPAEGIAIARRNFPILARFVEEARKTHSPDPFQREIEAVLERWYETEDPKVLLNLIGLGAGSTPSGDDVLVGIIAVMLLFEHVDARTDGALTQLRAGVRNGVHGRTTLPSAQMLLAACNRAFPEPILALLEAIVSSSVSHDEIAERCSYVLELGHHSGLAILSGLMVVSTHSHAVFEDPEHDELKSMLM